MAKHGGGVLAIVPKMAAGILNVLLAFVFHYKLRKHTSERTRHKRDFRSANLIAVVACATELCLNFFPSFSWFLLNYFGVYLTQLGPWISSLFGTDALVTAAIYQLILGRKSAKPTMVVTGTANAPLTQLPSRFVRFR
ncbi:hypothetical protein M3Y99_01633500 [Aphelenchoides fujianensis]|nr:hypothetical protein M3Y99_01633500 [Aphelenchoides fujianensis]